MGVTDGVADGVTLAADVDAGDDAVCAASAYTARYCVFAGAVDSSVQEEDDGTKRYSALADATAVVAYTTVDPVSTRRAKPFTPPVLPPPGWTG